MADVSLQLLPVTLAAFVADAARGAAGAAAGVPLGVLSPHGAVICVPRLDVGWRLSISKSAGGWRFWFSGEDETEPYVPLDLSLRLALGLRPVATPEPAAAATWRVELPSFFTPPVDPELYRIEPRKRYPVDETVFLTSGPEQADVLAIHLLTKKGELRNDPAVRYSPGGVPGEHFYEHDNVPLRPILDVIEELRAARRAAGVPIAANASTDARAVLKHIVQAHNETARELNAVAGPRTDMLPPSRYGLERYEARLTLGLDKDAELADSRDDEVQRIEAHFVVSGAQNDQARVVVVPEVITGGAAYDAFFSSLAFEDDNKTSPTKQLKALRKLLGVAQPAAASEFAVSARRDTVLVSTGAKAGLFNQEPMYLVHMRGMLGPDPMMLLFAGKFDGHDQNMRWETGGAKLVARVRADAELPNVDRQGAQWLFAMLYNAYLWAQRLAR